MNAVKTGEDVYCGKQFEAFILSAFTAETNTQAETEGNKEHDKMIVEAGGGLDEPRSSVEVNGGSLRTNCTKWTQEKICCDVYFSSS